MLSPALFRSRAFIAANGVSFFMYASLFGVLFLMMQFLQTALGYSPLAAGLRTLPWTGAPWWSPRSPASWRTATATGRS